MSLFSIPAAILGTIFTRNAVLGTLGGLTTAVLMRKSRQSWEKAGDDKVEALLDRISGYDMGRGAGKLLAGWIRFENPDIALGEVEKRFRRMLTVMDREDATPEERALSRFALSKAMFVLEGFHLSKGYYEDYQQQARYILGKNPKWREITREQVFKGKPFAPEAVIGATHRILLLLSKGRPYDFLASILENADLRDDPDYFSRLIALTMPLEDPAGLAPEESLSDPTERLTEAILQWAEEYRTFKLGQARQHEAMINTGIAAATGGLPAVTGIDLGKRVLKHLGGKIFRKKR